jgi:thiosulfate/3-mercaptopyruvate sulfurtransferase
MKSFRNLVKVFAPGVLALMLCAALASPMFAQFVQSVPPDPQIPSKQLISPEDLVQMLKTQKPLVLSIGPRSLYDQARIPGAEFIGGTSSAEGLNALTQRLKAEPKNKLIVLYCGCCPWNHCPNVHPAYKELRNLGYTNVRVLYIANNFGVDWVNKGYPTTRG